MRVLSATFAQFEQIIVAPTSLSPGKPQSDQTKDFAFGNLKTDLVDRNQPTETPRHTSSLECYGHDFPGFLERRLNSSGVIRPWGK